MSYQHFKLSRNFHKTNLNIKNSLRQDHQNIKAKFFKVDQEKSQYKYQKMLVLKILY
jgi:hypothetical protein